MTENIGEMPAACASYDEDGNVTTFRNVHVRLFGGWDSRKAGHAPWPAGSHRQPATNWKISRKPHAFEIQFWEVA